MEPKESQERCLDGVGIVPGTGIGTICRLVATPAGSDVVGPCRKAKGEHERERVLRATKLALGGLRALVASSRSQLDPIGVLVLRVERALRDHPDLLSEAQRTPEAGDLTLESAVSYVLETYASYLRKAHNGHFGRREAELDEIELLLETGLGQVWTQPGHADIAEPDPRADGLIIVADRLTPAALVNIDRKQVNGFVYEQAGTGSHSVLFAKAAGIPVVGNATGIMSDISCGDEALVDGDRGRCVVRPNEQTRREYRAALASRDSAIVPSNPVHQLKVLASINLACEVCDALAAGAEGIGLYRTEFEFFVAGRSLDEEEQRARYASVLKAMAGRPVYIRLLDFGGDKDMRMLPALFRDQQAEEEQDNPALGIRGCRWLLKHCSDVAVQIRALARAAEHGQVNVVYPMVIGLAQFKELKRILEREAQGIGADRLRHGVTFEVPAACIQAEELLKAADFGVIGANDLMQYLYATDRNNALVANDLPAGRKAFLRVVQRVAQTAKQLGRPLIMCGESAVSSTLLPVLMGRGIDTVSVAPRSVAGLRQSLACPRGKSLRHPSEPS